MHRESNHAFTQNLFSKKLGFTEDETTAVIQKLLRYHLLSSTTVEIDEEKITMYKVKMSQSFTAMIRFARELPQPETDPKYNGLSEACQETRVIYH